jgi:hypothetical protein
MPMRLLDLVGLCVVVGGVVVDQRAVEDGNGLRRRDGMRGRGGQAQSHCMLAQNHHGSSVFV